MKRSIFLVCNLFALVVIADAERLPQIAVPDNYRLIFIPDLTTEKYSGDETIHIRILKPTTSITLNSIEIEFKDVTLDAGNTSQKATVALDASREMATLTVAKQLEPGYRSHPFHGDSERQAARVLSWQGE